MPNVQNIPPAGPSHAAYIAQAIADGKPVESYSYGKWSKVAPGAVLPLANVQEPELYRVSPNANRKPLTNADFPRGTVLRFRSDSHDVRRLVVSIDQHGLSFQAGSPVFQTIAYVRFDDDRFLSGEIRRKLPGKQSLWIRAYSKE